VSELKKTWHVATAEGMEALGAIFASVIVGGGVVFLHGPLGAGKTTWTRGFLHARGHAGAVKSPTYTLVESYSLADGTVHHFDLYRLADPEELEYIGIRDYFSDDMLCLVEWPERGASVIGKADIELVLSYRGSERELSVCATSEKGRKIIQQMK